MRHHIIVFSVSSMTLLVVLVVAAWLTLGLEGSGMGLRGWLAMIFGSLVTGGLAVGLMAAIFASDRGGYDRAAGGGRTDDT
jgi:hypothetical protein